MNTKELCERASARVKIGPRGLDVLEGLLDGKTEVEIGDALGISPHTVHSHARNLYLKFDVHSRVDLFKAIVLSE